MSKDTTMPEAMSSMLWRKLQRCAITSMCGIEVN